MPGGGIIKYKRRGMRYRTTKQIIIIAAMCVCCFGAGAFVSGTVQKVWYGITARRQIPVSTGISNNQSNRTTPQTDSANTPSQGANQQPANAQNQNVKISLEQAKAIALEKAGFTENQVYFKKAKLDFDDGRWEYEIEFYKDYVEYDA